MACDFKLCSVSSSFVMCFIISQIAFWNISLHLPQYYRVYNGLTYVLQEPPGLTMDRVDSLTPDYPSSYTKSLQKSFKKTVSMNPGISIVPFRDKLQPMTDQELYSDQYREFHNDSNSQKLKASIIQLMDILTTEKRHCQKLSKFGGSFCNKRREGTKMICLDPDVVPRQDGGIVYSFGIGHDFSFDSKISDYGSLVFSFDDDQEHTKYKTLLPNEVTFIHVRLGVFNYVAENQVAGGFETITYRPIHNIMTSLGHTNETIDIIKMDIENDEWNVLEGSFFRTKILEKTKQLSIEIHLEVFKKEGTSSGVLLEETLRYIRILRGLESRGFQLAHYEPNYYAPKIREILGQRFPVYCETLWINTRFNENNDVNLFDDFYKDYVYPPDKMKLTYSEKDRMNATRDILKKVLSNYVKG